MDTVIKLDHAQLVAVLAAVMPMPEKSRITSIMEMEKNANPHNDSYKPKRRSDSEIVATLRVKEALAIVDEVYTQTMTKLDNTIGSLRR